MAKQHTDPERCQKLYEAIAYLDLLARKQLLKISRCQRSLSCNPRLRKETTTAKSSYQVYQDTLLVDKFHRRTYQIVRELSELCHHEPVFSAILSNLCRSAPFLQLSDIEVQNNREDSWQKEFDATQGPDRPRVLDYDVWFSEFPEDIYKSLSNHLRSSPGHNWQIRRNFRDWRASMAGRTFFPQLQTAKTLSRMTARLFHEEITETREGIFDKQVTSADLERLYARTGSQIAGGCEMRQAWKYNDLTPRTYFAQGGTTFHASKYIRDIANTLTDAFPQTHTKARFSYQDIAVTQDHTTFIYDYSSFTSNLTELKYFLDALSDFCQDTIVTTIDSQFGPVETSLGDLIREYNLETNIQSPFSIERWQEGNQEQFRHNRAGFLGVYGNIALSTCLHGLHACQLGGDGGDSKCVGDDVYGDFRPEFEHFDEVIERVQDLGDVNRKKFFVWWYRPIEMEEENNDRAYPYIKRPFSRLDVGMHLDQAIFLPIMGLIAPIPDGVHDDPEPLWTRIKVLVVQTRSVIKQAQAFFPPLTVHQTAMIEDYVRYLYQATGLPQSGRLPFERFICEDTSVSGLFVPRVTDGFLLQEPWSLLEERFVGPSVPVLAPRATRDQMIEEERISKEMGNQVESTGSRMLNYLEKMEWVTKERIVDLRYFEFSEYVAYFESLFDGELHEHFLYRLSEYAPDWVHTVLCTVVADV